MEPQSDEFVQKDPESKLERAFIAEYLERRGHTVASVLELPAPEAVALMTEASIYASAKLSEVEARAHYLHDIHDASKPST